MRVKYVAEVNERLVARKGKTGDWMGAKGNRLAVSAVRSTGGWRQGTAGERGTQVWNEVERTGRNSLRHPKTAPCSRPELIARVAVEKVGGRTASVLPRC